MITDELAFIGCPIQRFGLPIPHLIKLRFLFEKGCDSTSTDDI